MKNSLVRNLLVTGVGRFGGMLIQLIVTVVLARFLTPVDFGIVAMCTIFLNISEMLVDSGMGGSVVFYNDVEEIELHTLFWTNLGLSIIIYITLFFTSGLIASFYEVPILENIIKIIGISIVVHSLCIIQSTLLSKNLEFKAQSKIMVLSAVFSSIVVLILGYNGFGVWTLVAQPITLKLFQVFFYFRMGIYKPKFQYSLHSLRRHWIFGSRLLGTSFLKLIYDNLYIQIIGKVINLKDAGYYAQAARFNDMPTNLLTFSLDKVIFPTLAKSENRMAQMDKITRIFACLVIPVLLLGSLVSKEVIIMLLGNKWADSGWMLSFLLMGTIGASFEVLNRCFLKATGETGILLRYDLVKRGVNIVLLIVSSYWALKGFLMAFIINGVIGWLFNCFALKKAINYNLREQISNVVLVAVTAIVPYAIIYYVMMHTEMNVFVEMIVKITGYVAMYLVLFFVFFKNEVKEILKKLPLKSKK